MGDPCTAMADDLCAYSNAAGDIHSVDQSPDHTKPVGDLRMDGAVAPGLRYVAVSRIA